MGTIDSTSYTLGCATCGTTEAKRVLDKGSGWGGSSWQSGADFEKFETMWSGGGAKEPDLALATCKKCGKDASVKSSFGGM